MRRIFSLLFCLALVLSLAVLPVSQADTTQLVVDSTLAQTNQNETNLINEPAIIVEVRTPGMLAGLNSTEKPSNAILTLDRNCNVVGSDGQSLGTFAEVYAKLDKKILPVVYIANDEVAQAFIGYNQTTLNVRDLAVMSVDPAVVKTVRQAMPYLRGVLKCEQVDVENLYDIVATAQLNMASVVTLPQDVATAKNVMYLQARFKAVWVWAQSDSNADIMQCVNSGAYGVITTPSRATEVLATYPTGVTRPIFNVAHRGVQAGYTENSVGSVLAAIECGATHVEIDGMLTKDGEIVIMHDDTLTRTTNGTGSVANMTLAEIQRYQLDLGDTLEDIPTLEDVLDAISSQETDIVLTLEIKCNAIGFVPKLKEILDEKQFYENIVVITFDSSEHQMEPMLQYLPQIPVAHLDNISATNFMSNAETIGKYTASLSVTNGNASDEYNQNILRDRGIIGWFWTYANATSIVGAAQKGIVGVTNNAAESYSEAIKHGEIFSSYGKNSIPAVGDTTEVLVTRYNGLDDVVEGKIVAVEQTESGYRIFASYTDEYNGLTMFTQGVDVKVPQSNVAIWAIVAGVAFVAGIVVAVILLKKQKN